jgi:hypothetical protein
LRELVCLTRRRCCMTHPRAYGPNRRDLHLAILIYRKSTFGSAKRGAWLERCRWAAVSGRGSGRPVTGPGNSRNVRRITTLLVANGRVRMDGHLKGELWDLAAATFIAGSVVSGLAFIIVSAIH